jgi:hypothetical protein
MSCMFCVVSNLLFKYYATQISQDCSITYQGYVSRNTLGERSNLSISTAAMHRLLLLLISCCLSLTSALSIPCPSNPQPGSTSCQVLDNATQTLDGPTAVVGSKPNVLENRGRPIPTHAEDSPLRMLPHRYEPTGIFTSRDDGEMGPYRLQPGTYQIYIRWIGQFIPGPSKPHPTAPLSSLSNPLPELCNRGGDQARCHVQPADGKRRRTIATLYVMPRDDSLIEFMDIVICPATTLGHLLRASGPVEFDLRLTDDSFMPDGSFDRRPSRAQASWSIRTQ